MRTATCLDINFRHAKRALLSYWFHRWCFFLFLESVDSSNKEKDCKRNDHEADDGVDEYTVIDGHCTR